MHQSYSDPEWNKFFEYSEATSYYIRNDIPCWMRVMAIPANATGDLHKQLRRSLNRQLHSKRWHN